MPAFIHCLNSAYAEVNNDKRSSCKEAWKAVLSGEKISLQEGFGNIVGGLLVPTTVIGVGGLAAYLVLTDQVDQWELSDRSSKEALLGDQELVNEVDETLKEDKKRFSLQKLNENARKMWKKIGKELSSEKSFAELMCTKDNQPVVFGRLFEELLYDI